MKNIWSLCFIIISGLLGTSLVAKEDDHDKAIKAVNEGEILPLDKIVDNVNQEFDGRILSVNLKDSEKGLFGWIYDIMIIESSNRVIKIKVDAGTATVLSVISGGEK